MKIILLSIILIATNLFANIGKITAVKGDAQIIRNSKHLIINVGDTIEQKDKIIIGEHSRLQLIFNDKTIISLGKNSTFDVEEYFYDENQPEKTIATFKVSKGIFKSITGRIGKINPKKFKLKTKSSSIGIRGTIFFGEIKPNGQESIACTQGSIVVETEQGILDIQAGEFTKVEFGKAPTLPQKITERQKKSLEKDSGSDANSKESSGNKEDNQESQVSNNVQDIASDILNAEQQSNIQSNLEVINTKNTHNSNTTFIQEFDHYENKTTFSSSLLNTEYQLTKNNQLLEITNPAFSLNEDLSDDEINWGFWGEIANSTNLDTFDAQYAWITGKDVVEDIQATLGNGTASYTGKIMGFTNDGTFIDPINSTIVLSFDFGANIANATLIANGGNMTITDITGGIYNAVGSEYTITNGSDILTGSFFNNGGTTAGKFETTNGNGVYKGSLD